MKKSFYLIIAMLFILQSSYGQYQYVSNLIAGSMYGPIRIHHAYSTSLEYAKLTPAYNEFEPATSSVPTIPRYDDGRFIIDYSDFVKPSKTVIRNIVRSCFVGYIPVLKTALGGKGQIWISIQTDSVGVFKNAYVQIWAEPEVYKQIPPDRLASVLNSIDNLPFTIPEEYQCISDHYFLYALFFKDW